MQTLPKRTSELLNQLSNQGFLSPFYLSGGTALALEIGHRESEDLDFFNQNDFNPLALQQTLLRFGNLENVEIASGTLNLFLNGVKLQFLHYPYILLESTVPWNGIVLSSELDIACTKIMTVSMRGSKKDFVDMFFILQKHSLSELFEKLPQKYTGTDYNLPHILKSLIYFADADLQPMPRMHIDVSWDEVKKTIVRLVKSFDL